MYHLLIAVEKCLDATLTSQISEVCQKTDKFIITYIYTVSGIDIEKSMIDIFLTDTFEVKAQLLAGSYKTLGHYLWLAIGHDYQA